MKTLLVSMCLNQLRPLWLCHTVSKVGESLRLLLYPIKKITSKAIIGVPLVMDDIGVFWCFLSGEERITVLDNEGKPADGGYYCMTIEGGISQLKHNGYIS